MPEGPCLALKKQELAGQLSGSLAFLWIHRIRSAVPWQPRGEGAPHVCP